MKELWVQLKDIVAKHGLPSTIQGVTYKAKVEKWKRRRVSGVKGRVYEYEVSSILNKKNNQTTEIWLTTKDLIGKYNLPNTVQGLAKKARNENWEKRRVKGQKGGGFEYEVSDIINKFELLQNYKKGLDNKPQTQSSNHNEDEKKTNGIPVNDDFFKNYIMVGDLGIETTNSNDLKITTNGTARIILSKDFVEQQGLLNAKLATFTVTDDSMADTIKNGDTLMVSVCDETEQQKAVDGIYVILFNGVLMVKRLQYNPVKVSYNVISDNLDYQPFTVTPKEEPTFKVIAKLERVLSKK